MLTPMTTTPQIGLLVPPDWFTRPQPERQARIDAASQAGLDHLAVGDHVSFFVGAGFDGLTQATALLAQHPTLRVHVAVYLLALRHPVPLARTLATIAELAPGRLALGVGVGGEDRHEIEICGVDPATRGSRTDEALAIVRGLLSGEPQTFHGRHFDLDDAVILPAPTPPIPLLVGGRSDAALRRAARHGDGWLGIWVSDRRFAQAAATVAELAEAAGREVATWQHELNVWCAFGPDRERARAHVAPAMEGFYATPFERFARYAPHGRPEDVAGFLAPYVEAGCRSLNLIAANPDAAEAVDGVAEVRRLLRGRVVAPEARLAG
jgi:alkanesulfonate monooxygenase SsuD/methylene tetrahydromethanopterin reductase-like flavin-dependent oxidoreductase (luciferase family)